MRGRRAVFPRCSRQASDIDGHVGRRIEERRRDLHLSQEALAEAIRLNLRQVHGYESGAVRLPPAILAAIAEFLRAPISYFFVGMTLDAEAGGTGRLAGEAKPDRRQAAATHDGD